MKMKIISFFIAFAVFISDIFGIGITSKINHEYLNLSYGENERQVLDLYIPKDADDEISLVLLIHGGWWISGDKESNLRTIQRIADNERIAAAAINYRYLSHDTDMYDLLDDIENALKVIKEKGKEHGTNINKVMLRGYSAGGHLSLLYAYSRKNTSPITPVAVISDAGISDLCDENIYVLNDKSFVTQLFSYAIGETFTYENRSAVREKLERISPLYYVDDSTVPTIINHGKMDNVIPFSNAESLDQKLNENCIEHDFSVYPTSDHGLSNDNGSDDAADKLFEKYCKIYLK